MIKKEQAKGDVLKKLGAPFDSEMQAYQKSMEFKQNGYEYRENILAHINEVKEELISEAESRGGIQKEHTEKYLNENITPDFQLLNVVTRMIDHQIITPENGYQNPQQVILELQGKKQRRTMKELD